MAESIQRNVENMVPELEDLHFAEIFSLDEIRAIVKKRTDLEYSIQRMKKEISDFDRYIEYETNLYELLQLRIKRKKERSKNNNAKGLVQDNGLYAFERRTRKIHQRMVLSFKHIEELWLRYIDFCEKQSNRHIFLNQIFIDALQLHPRSSKLWLKAAHFEFMENNISSTRKLLQRALRILPDSQELWLFFFRVEFMYILKLRQRKKTLGLIGDTFLGRKGIDEFIDGQDTIKLEKHVDVSDENDKKFLCGAMPQAIFRHAIQTKELKKDLEFRLKFVEIVPKDTSGQFYQDFLPVINGIFQTVIKDFSHLPQAWNARAQWAIQFSQIIQKQDICLTCGENGCEEIVLSHQEFCEIHKRKLCITNISPNTELSTLRESFSKYGDISECELIKIPNNLRCFGFITFKDDSALNNILANQEVIIDSNILKIRPAVSIKNSLPGLTENRAFAIFEDAILYLPSKEIPKILDLYISFVSNQISKYTIQLNKVQNNKIMKKAIKRIRTYLRNLMKKITKNAMDQKYIGCRVMLVDQKTISCQNRLKGVIENINAKTYDIRFDNGEFRKDVAKISLENEINENFFVVAVKELFNAGKLNSAQHLFENVINKWYPTSILLWNLRIDIARAKIKKECTLYQLLNEKMYQQLPDIFSLSMKHVREEDKPKLWIEWCDVYITYISDMLNSSSSIHKLREAYQRCNRCFQNAIQNLYQSSASSSSIDPFDRESLQDAADKMIIKYLNWNDFMHLENDSSMTNIENDDDDDTSDTDNDDTSDKKKKENNDLLLRKSIHYVVSLPRVSFSVYQKLIQIEKKIATKQKFQNQNIIKIRTMNEKMIGDFSQRINSWISCIEWELTNGTNDGVTRAYQLHRRALRDLSSDSIDDFSRIYEAVIDGFQKKRKVPPTKSTKNRQKRKKRNIKKKKQKAPQKKQKAHQKKLKNYTKAPPPTKKKNPKFMRVIQQ